MRFPACSAGCPPGYRPIVVDNGSTDGSAALAASLGARGRDRAARAASAPPASPGLSAATADVVCFMDADGSLDPGDLPLVATRSRAGGADLVLGGARAGARGLAAARAARQPRARRRSCAAAAGRALTDLGPMRAARRRTLLDLGIADRRFGWPLEMVLRAAAAGWRIDEVPVPLRRASGRSKVTGTVRGTLRAVRDMGAVLR